MIGRGALALVLSIAACGRDVRLGGGASIDGAIDGLVTGNPFTPGTYTMHVLDPAQVGCMGSLAGSEASFSSITRASLNLIDGAVTLSTPSATMLTVAGTPVMNALAQSSITLAADSNLPPGFWDGLVSGDFSNGPLSTMRTATDLAVDTTTASAPTGIEAQLSVLYTTVDASGSCGVTFGVTFTRP